MQYQCRVIILHGLQRKGCRKDGVLARPSSNKSDCLCNDTDYSQKTLYWPVHSKPQKMLILAIMLESMLGYTEFV